MEIEMLKSTYSKTVFIFLIAHLFLLAQDKTDFSIRTTNNNEIKLSELYNKGPVLVNFWALWCEPCKAEMKVLKNLYKKYQDKGFTILGINQDSPKSVSKVRAYISSQKINFPTALDPNNQYLQKFNGQSIPYSLLINKNGEIVYKSVGYLPGDEVKLENQIQKLLPEVQ
jgi:cytochrome c biogenesis protein CcmG/thiol:disulfide interchange protein DsbE